MSNIIWKQSNGNIAVTTILNGDGAYAHADLLLKRGDVPKDWSLLAVDVDDFPTWPIQEDWDYNNGFSVNKDRAVESTKARLRREREPALAELDKQVLIAQRKGEDLTALYAQYAPLLDVTKLATADLTLDQLAALTVEA